MPEFEVVTLREAMLSSTTTGKRSQIALGVCQLSRTVCAPTRPADSYPQMEKPLPRCAVASVRRSRRREEASK